MGRGLCALQPLCRHRGLRRGLRRARPELLGALAWTLPRGRYEEPGRLWRGEPQRPALLPWPTASIAGVCRVRLCAHDGGASAPPTATTLEDGDGAPSVVRPSPSRRQVVALWLFVATCRRCGVAGPPVREAIGARAERARFCGVLGDAGEPCRAAGARWADAPLGGTPRTSCRRGCVPPHCPGLPLRSPTACARTDGALCCGAAAPLALSALRQPAKTCASRFRARSRCLALFTPQ